MDKLQTLMQNKEMMKKVMGAGSPKAAYELLREQGLDCKYEEFIHLAETAALSYEKQKAGLLTEEDMEELLDCTQSEGLVGTTPFLFFIICKS